MTVTLLVYVNPRRASCYISYSQQPTLTSHCTYVVLAQIWVRQFSKYFYLSLKYSQNSVAIQYKKLSCRRKTARRFVSLNILLSHSRSVKVCMVQFVILSVKLWRDLEISVGSHSRSLKMAPFDRPLHDLLSVSQATCIISEVKWDIGGKNHECLYPLHLTPLLGGGGTWEYWHNVWCRQTRMVRLLEGEEVWWHVQLIW